MKKTSNYKGVTWNKAAGKWHARIRKNGICVNLGLYTNAEDAHKIYLKVRNNNRLLRKLISHLYVRVDWLKQLRLDV